MAPKLNVAVIGVGNIGLHHCRVYSEIKDVRNFSVPNTQQINLSKEEPLKIEILNFVDHIINSTDNVVKAREGLDVLKIARTAINKAMRNKK